MVGKSIRIPLDSAEVARVRFAVSPVYETFMAVGVLREPGAHAVHLPWVRWARPQLDQIPETALVGTFFNRHRKPGFLLPVPDIRMPSLEDELRRIRATPPDQVRTFFNRNSPSMGKFHRALYDDPPEGLARLSDALQSLYDLLIAPYWPRLLGVLEADIAHRASILAEGGVAAVFHGLHRDVEWTGGELIKHGSQDARQVQLSGRALVLSPSAFCWPNVWISMRPTNAGVLRYPARAIATVWETRRPAPDALTALLGRTRAELLLRLAEPATTADLAAVLGVTAGAVSQHLGVLRASGLVATRRDGRTVLHLRTERAEALVR